MVNFFEGDSFIGNALALSGAVTAAAYLLVGRFLRPTMSLVVYIFTVYVNVKMGSGLDM